MFVVLPDITILGTFLSSLQISWAALDLIQAYNSKQTFHKCFGALDLSSLDLLLLKLFYISFCSIWPESIWLQMFQMTCSTFELLIELSMYHLFGIVAYTSWWDSIPSKQQWHGLMCFTPGCHWKSSSPSKICGIYLCISVAPSGHCTGKHSVKEYRVSQATITKIPIIDSESSWQQRVEHGHNPSLSCDLW